MQAPDRDMVFSVIDAILGTLPRKFNEQYKLHFIPTNLEFSHAVMICQLLLTKMIWFTMDSRMAHLWALITAQELPPSESQGNQDIN